MDCWPQVTHTHTKIRPAGLTKWTDSTLQWRSKAYEYSWKSECFLNGACSLGYNKNRYKNKSLKLYIILARTMKLMTHRCNVFPQTTLKKDSIQLTTKLHSTSAISLYPVRKHNAVEVKVTTGAPERQQNPPKKNGFAAGGLFPCLVSLSLLLVWNGTWSLFRIHR